MKTLCIKKISHRQVPKALGCLLGTVVAILLAALIYHFFFAFQPLTLSKEDEIRAKIFVASGVYHVGDIIPVTMEVESRKNVGFGMPDLSNMGLGSLEIVSKSDLITEKPYGGIRRKINYQLTAWEAGKHRLNGFNLSYRGKGGAQRTYPVRSCFINVKSLLPAGKSRQGLASLSVKDAKKPVGMPPRYFILWWIIGVLAGCGLLWMLFKYLRRFWNSKKEAPATSTPIIPPAEAAHVIALRRLAALEKMDYLRRQAFKPYYTELAECIREYLENRFRMKALEMTTEEFLESLTTAGTLGPAHQQILAEFLQAADLVKFAKCLPSPSEAEKSLALTKQLIEETKEKSCENGASGSNINLSSQENGK